ncbi:MAG: hypothetical protein AB1847_23145, partial [bacterium]
MSQWTDRINQHPVHGVIRTLESLLIDVDLSGVGQPDKAIADIERIRQVLNLIKSRLELTDPNLVPFQALKNIQNSLHPIINEVSAFKANKNVAHLTNANNHLENILTYLNDIPSPTNAVDIESVKDAVSSLRRSVGQYLRNIDDEVTSLNETFNEGKTSLNSLSFQIESLKQRTDTIVSNFQQQFSTTEENRRTEFQKAQADTKKAAAELIDDIKTDWNELLEEKGAALQSFLTEAKTSLEQIKNEAISTTDAFIRIIQDRKKKAEDLVGIITDTGMVGGYQRVANDAKASARKWRLIAVSSLAGLVIFALVVFYESLSQVIRWDQIATRIFVATSFGVLATYAALQADKRERTERKNRKVELELASILPYLHDLPLEQQ